MHTHSHWEAKPLGMFPGKTYRGYPDWILQETSDYSRGYTSELLVKRELECFYTSVPNSHWLRATLRKPLIPRKALHEHRQRGSNHLRQPSRKKKKNGCWMRMGKHPCGQCVGKWKWIWGNVSQALKLLLHSLREDLPSHVPGLSFFRFSPAIGKLFRQQVSTLNDSKEGGIAKLDQDWKAFLNHRLKLTK